jgi:hypothetical protein
VLLGAAVGPLSPSSTLGALLFFNIYLWKSRSVLYACMLSKYITPASTIPKDAFGKFLWHLTTFGGGGGSWNTTRPPKNVFPS